MIYKTRTHILCVRHKTESKQCYTSGPLIPVDTWTPAVLLFKRLILKTLWKMKVQSGLRRERPSDRPGDYSNRTLAPDYPLGTPAQLCISRYVPKHYIILPLLYCFHFGHPTVYNLCTRHTIAVTLGTHIKLKCSILPQDNGLPRDKTASMAVRKKGQKNTALYLKQHPLTWKTPSL